MITTEKLTNISSKLISFYFSRQQLKFNVSPSALLSDKNQASYSFGHIFKFSPSKLLKEYLGSFFYN